MSRKRARHSISLFCALVASSGLVLAGASANAEIWGIKSCGSSPGLCPSFTNPSEPPARLFRFAEDGSGITSLDILTLSGVQIDVDGLAVSAQEELYAFHLVGSVPPPATGSQLVTIDASTGAVTIVGFTLSGREIRGATFDPLGRLWAVDALADELLQIDVATGAVIGAPVPLTLSGSPLDVTTASDLAARATGEMLLLEARLFFDVDPLTGVLVQVYEETTNDDEANQPPFFCGLAIATEPGNDLFAYDVAGEEDLYAYGVGFSESEVYSDILASFNSGRGDLASALPAQPVPSLDGLRQGILIALLLALATRTVTQAPSTHVRRRSGS